MISDNLLRKAEDPGSSVKWQQEEKVFNRVSDTGDNGKLTGEVNIRCDDHRAFCYQR